MLQLPEDVKILNKDGNRTVFEISPLMPGYGPTIVNPLRRILLSSLEGSAVTSIKIEGVNHEFSSLAGVHEDVIQIILNVKKIKFHSYANEPVVATLNIKGENDVLARDIKVTSDVEIINPDQHILTITDKKTAVSMELTIEKGIGYVPVEQRQKDKLPIGVLAIDAIFSPVKLVNFRIEDIRVGQRIDYNRVILEIETNGSISPEAALKNATDILIKHFNILAAVKVPSVDEKQIGKKKNKKTKADNKEEAGG